MSKKQSKKLQHSIPSKFVLNHKDLQVIKVIGSGAFGEVSVGIYLPTETKVAIKKLHILESNERNEELYIREVECLSSLKHKFLLPFIGFTESYPYCIVTKYISGGTLYSAIHNDDCEEQKKKPKKLNPTELNIIAYGIANGMKYLHKKKIIHRDLKTQNILLDKNKKPVICDFGSSRRMEMKKTMTITSVGTSNYMAPEFFEGEYDEKVDVYAYAMMIWEMLTKEIPFDGYGDAQVLYMVKFKNQRPTIPTETPQGLKNLIEKCWSNDPKERLSFQEIEQLLLSGEVEFPGTDRNKFQSAISYDKKISNEKTKSFNNHTQPNTLSSANIPPPIRIQKIQHRNKKQPRSCGFLDVPISEIQTGENYLQQIENNTANIPEVLSFFEKHCNEDICFNFSIWKPFLMLISSDSEYQTRIYNLLMHFSQSVDIVKNVQKVENLHLYLNPKTIDFFLYFITYSPNIISIDLVNVLFNLSKQPEISKKAIILLCKICKFAQQFKNNIIDFFIKNVNFFINFEASYDLMMMLTSENKVTKSMIISYSESNNPSSVIAAYKATFSLVSSTPEFFNLDLILKHIISENADLRNESLEFIRRYAENIHGVPLSKICEALLISSQRYLKSENAILILCRYVDINDSFEPPIIFKSAKNWLLSANPTQFLNLFIVLFKKESRIRRFFAALTETYTFLNNILISGSKEIYLPICYLLRGFDDEFNVKLVQTGIIPKICNILLKTKEPDSVEFVLEVINKVAKSTYCNEFNQVVVYLINLINEKITCSMCCLITLCILSSQNQTHESFFKANFFPIFSRFNSSSKEAKEMIDIISSNLKKFSNY